MDGILLPAHLVQKDSTPTDLPKVNTECTELFRLTRQGYEMATEDSVNSVCDRWHAYDTALFDA